MGAPPVMKLIPDLNVVKELPSTTCAIIMAGGRSERMRATLPPDHKSLVRILGIPLLERNLCKLLAEGFRDIVVTMNACEVAIEQLRPSTWPRPCDGKRRHH